MKLQKLIIENKYKNVRAQEIDFSVSNGCSLLIGNNGSGKSNLIELISIIFAGLYCKSGIQNFNTHPSFNYKLSYSINEKNIHIIYRNEGKKKNSSYQFFLNDKELPQNQIKDYLPSQVVCSYSGEELRIWNDIYEDFYFDYIKNVKGDKSKGIAGNPYANQNLIFINKYYWQIALLGLFYHDFEVFPQVKDFCEQTLKINYLNAIHFEFDNKKLEEWEKNSGENIVTHFVKALNPQKKNALDINIVELKKRLEQLAPYPEDFFRFLSIASLPIKDKLITKVEVSFNEDNLSIGSLSEGEKKLLLIKTILDFVGGHNSLILLDEPDSHVHLLKKEQIFNLLKDYKDRNSLITTHSPTLTNAFDERNLFMLNNGNVIDKKKQSIISDLTGSFWNKPEQNLFNASDKPIILFVEGKHDKIHIEKAFSVLKDEYPNLSFDIFNMDGASNIPQMLTGLRTSDIKHDRLFVAIFDNDKEGIDCCNKTQVKYNGNTKQVKKGFTAFCYPKPADYKHPELTVENLFEPIHYQQAYNEIVAEYSFGNKSIDAISSEIKDKAKGRLSALSSNLYDKSDFVNFKPIFNKLTEIYSKYNDSSDSLLEGQSSNKPTVTPNNIEDEKSQPTKQNMFYLKTKGVTAKAIFNKEDQSLIVLQGSEILIESVPSEPKDSITRRNAKIKSLKHIVKSDRIILEEDVKFDKPSPAAHFVYGGGLNGWDRWKDNSGKSLNVLYKSLK